MVGGLAKVPSWDSQDHRQIRIPGCDSAQKVLGRGREWGDGKGIADHCGLRKRGKSEEQKQRRKMELDGRVTSGANLVAVAKHEGATEQDEPQ